MSWIVSLLAFVVGALAGYFLSRRFSDSQQQVRDLQAGLDAEREQHASYRREVSEHFARTALAVNQMTESYRSVHQQLSEGASALCDNASAETALAFEQSRLLDSPIETPAAPEEAAAADADCPEPTLTGASDSPSQVTVPDDTADPELPPDEPPASTLQSAPHATPPPGSESTVIAEEPLPTEAPQPPRDYADEDDNGQGKTLSGSG